MRARPPAGPKDRTHLERVAAQRVFSSSSGSPDAYDSERLSTDRIHKMLLNREPPLDNT
jgi:hypothetical protein